MSLDFVEQVQEELAVELDTGYGGVTLKGLVPNKGDKVSIIFPCGFNDTIPGPGGEVAVYDDDGTAAVYTGKDVDSFKSGVFWMNAEHLNASAKEAMGIESKRFTRTFLCAAEKTGNEWYTDLGYNATRDEEKQALADGVITEFSIVEKSGGKFFAGNTVFPQLWYHVPVIVVKISGRGKDMTVNYQKIVWLKLKPTSGQWYALLNAFKGIETSENYKVFGRVLTVENTGDVSNYYDINRTETIMPEDTHEDILAMSKRVTDSYGSLFKTVFVNQHDSNMPSSVNAKSDKASNEAVKKYLLGITNFDKWEDFVDAYSIKADPLDEDDFDEVDALFFDEVDDEEELEAVAS